MGKKSKRHRHPPPPPPTAAAATAAAAVARNDDEMNHHGSSSNKDSCKRHRTMTVSSNHHHQKKKNEEETIDNLIFQDPFVDVLEKDQNEMIIQNDITTTNRNNHNDNEEEEEEDNDKDGIQVWNPFSSNTEKEQEEEMELDLTAYKMYHALSVEWPSLSFCILHDTLGMARSKFPHSLTFCAGTQANTTSTSSSVGRHANSLTIVTCTDLAKVHVETENDILGEEYNHDNEEDEDDSSDDDSDELDVDPCLNHTTIPHDGGVNRLRCMPHYNHMVSTWSDTSQVYIYNIQSSYQQLLQDDANTTSTTTLNTSVHNKKNPIYTYEGHVTEGFAMDWSPVNCSSSGGSCGGSVLATGDCHGDIHIWQMPNDSDFSVTKLYESEQQHSVEDLQWSPTESTVLAAGECGGRIKIYDVRVAHQAQITKATSSSKSNHAVDVNGLSWNRLVPNLLATGHDDGVWQVWDLRTFTEPLARFTCHKTPITSLEWHPTDESMLAITDDVGTYLYDLSVEPDDDGDDGNDNNDPNNNLPPQLLFCHSGSTQFKEVHWHPQITSCVMTTALSGFSIFIPSNL